MPPPAISSEDREMDAFLDDARKKSVIRRRSFKLRNDYLVTIIWSSPIHEESSHENFVNKLNNHMTEPMIIDESTIQ